MYNSVAGEEIENKANHKSTHQNFLTLQDQPHKIVKHAQTIRWQQPIHTLHTTNI